jgi:hypothetical protein
MAVRLHAPISATTYVLASEATRDRTFDTQNAHMGCSVFAYCRGRGRGRMAGFSLGVRTQWRWKHCEFS